MKINHVPLTAPDIKRVLGTDNRATTFEVDATEHDADLIYAIGLAMRELNGIEPAVRNYTALRERLSECELGDYSASYLNGLRDELADALAEVEACLDGEFEIGEFAVRMPDHLFRALPDIAAKQEIGVAA